MKELLFDLMAKISGQAYNPAWEEKVFSIVNAGLFVIIFLLVFAILFYKYARHDYEMKKLGIITVSVLSVFIIGKFILFRLCTGYIPDRLFFFALPSPKIENPMWLFLSIFIFLLFLLFRENILRLKVQNFLVVTCLVFFTFSTAVAGIREGRAGIMDPMTRTHLEYTGNIGLIGNTHDFLRDYTKLIPKLAVHATTHPPGYSLLVYYFGKIVGFSLFGISLLIILTAGISIFPLYCLLKQFFDERIARNVLQLYIFMPSIILMSGTSLEAFFLTAVWLTIALLLIGWRKSWRLSAFGGLAAGLAFFSNFLFLLLAPFFAGLLYYVYLQSEKNKRALVIVRSMITLLAFILFFIALWRWSGYSVIENFIIARGENQGAVINNFSSMGTYLTFLIMNVLSFGFALGIVNLLFFIKNRKDFFIKSRPELWIGFTYVAFLLMIGVFQGELARLWMFVVPFFLPALARGVARISQRQFSTVLSLLFLQIVLVQILFYTYW